MEISYGCVYKRSSKPVMKGSRVETIEDARKEYKQLSCWRRVGRRHLYIKVIFKKFLITSSLIYRIYF
ncbi:conserved hypothetical protein [Prochlorococcus marinus str. MIT 9202]|nr:conserved hypothetical protein [Prochlorococcus marinus str. MIT 9202]